VSVALATIFIDFNPAAPPAPLFLCPEHPEFVLGVFAIRQTGVASVRWTGVLAGIHKRARQPPPPLLPRSRGIPTGSLPARGRPCRACQSRPTAHPAWLHGQAGLGQRDPDAENHGADVYYIAPMKLLLIGKRIAHPPLVPGIAAPPPGRGRHFTRFPGAAGSRPPPATLGRALRAAWRGDRKESCRVLCPASRISSIDSNRLSWSRPERVGRMWPGAAPGGGPWTSANRILCTQEEVRKNNGFSS